jgi:hypothetical protein
MSSEAAGVTPMPAAGMTEGKRRGRRTAKAKEKGRALVLFYLGERERDGKPLILKEGFESEGAAMVEALKRAAPYYRVEVWQSRAVVKDGSVEIKKEPVTVEQ